MESKDYRFSCCIMTSTQLMGLSLIACMGHSQASLMIFQNYGVQICIKMSRTIFFLRQLNYLNCMILSLLLLCGHAFKNLTYIVNYHQQLLILSENQQRKTKSCINLVFIISPFAVFHRFSTYILFCLYNGSPV